MASWKYVSGANFQKGTIGATFSAGATSLTLTTGHGARLPSSGDFWMLIYSSDPQTGEIIKCTARSTDTCTVTRGQDGTADSSWASGDNFVAVMSVSALDQFRQDICQTGAYASAAAEKAGRIYLPNDGVHFLRDTGSAFAAWGPIFPVTLPVDGDFSWVNQGTSTVTATSGGIVLAPQSASDNWRLRVKSAPATPYTITAGFLPDYVDEQYFIYALGFRNSSSGKLVIVYWSNDNNGELWVQYWPAPNSSAGVTNLRSSGADKLGKPPQLLQISDDGTNIKFRVGNSGLNFPELASQGRTVSMGAAPDQVFWGMNFVSSAGIQQYVTLFHWKES